MQLIQNLNDRVNGVIVFRLVAQFALVARDLTNCDHHNSEQTQNTQTLSLNSSLVKSY